MDNEKKTEENGQDSGPLSPFLSSRHLRLHDFQKPRLVSDERLRALESIHRKFTRAATVALSALVRARAQVELTCLSQKTYFEFIRSLPNPTCLCLAYSQPVSPSAAAPRIPFVLEIDPSALFLMIERLLGGKGDGRVPPARPLTRIEQELARSIAEQILGALRESWVGAVSSAPGAAATEAERLDIHFDMAEIEHNPLLLQIVGPSEPALVISFQVSMGAAGIAKGQIQICLPLRPFDPLLSRLTRAALPGRHGERNSPEERERILERLADTGLELSAELASVPIALPDLLSLRPGDVIDTQVGRTAEIALVGDLHGDDLHGGDLHGAMLGSGPGRKVFRGQPATRDGRRAVRITGSDGE